LGPPYNWQNIKGKLQVYNNNKTANIKGKKTKKFTTTCKVDITQLKLQK